MFLFSSKGKYLIAFLLLLGVVVLTSCGDNTNKEPSKTDKTENTSGLTDFELENGIGPVKKKLELGPIDPMLVKKGQEIFDTKCAACHKLDERYVGPAQRDIIKRRTPEYIINYMLNPDENLHRHPEAKKLLAEYMTPMPNQNLTIDDAKALLDYFREVAEEK
ncbi:MAG: cytochrome c [Ignavibacteriaceae bacterium]|jgi:mono/diheme cytochrome c family protein|nr:cytochrome c [Ignavibacteriaceae bacterium]